MSEVYPSIWNKILLADICSQITDGTHHSPLNESRGDYLYVTAKNIKSWGLDISNITFVSKEIHHQIYTRCPVEYEDVLYIKDGVTTGLAAVNHLKEPFSMLSSVALLKPIRNVLDPYFLKNWLNSPVAFKLITDQMTGTAIKRVVLRQLRNVEIPLPPLNEQRRIVSAIEQLTDRSNKARTALADIPKLIEQFRQSVLAAAFRGDLTADWREQNPDVEPASELLERIKTDSNSTLKNKYSNTNSHDRLPDGWCWTRVDSIGKVSLGRQRSPKYHQGTQMRPYMRSANITWNGWDLSDVNEMNFDDRDFATFKLERGDVLINEGSGSADEVGKPAIWNDEIPDCCFQNTLISVRPFERMSKYIYFVFLNAALSKAFVDETRGVNIHHIGKQGLTQFLIPLTSLQEQAEIVSRIEKCFKSIQSIEEQYKKSHEQLEILDRSILAKAFRGELVPQDPDDEPAAVLLERIRAERAAISPKQRGKTTRKNNSNQLSINLE